MLFRSPPGRHSQSLVVRKALVDAGRVKTLADIKGLRVATAAVGSSAMGTLERLYKLGGFTANDIEKATLNVPQQIAALQNGAIDAAFPTEPVGTMVVRQGIAVRLATDADLYPGHQIAVIYFSGKLRQERPQVARAFMRAYLRGVRAQNASIIDGKIAGRDAEEFIVSWAQEHNLKKPFKLVVHLGQVTDRAEAERVLQGAIRNYFNYRYEFNQRELKQLLRYGWKIGRAHV